MDNITESQRILDKKLDSYSQSMNNFMSENEITLTITLNEYRDLIGVAATTKALVEKANEDKYKREDENKKLVEENARLKAELYEMNKRIETCESVPQGEQA